MVLTPATMIHWTEAQRPVPVEARLADAPRAQTYPPFEGRGIVFAQASGSGTTPPGGTPPGGTPPAGIPPAGTPPPVTPPSAGGPSDTLRPPGSDGTGGSGSGGTGGGAGGMGGLTGSQSQR